MRELIRLLSSRLPIGKISGTWGFILPLLYNLPSLSLPFCLSLSISRRRSPALYFFHTRCRQNLSAITNQSLHSLGPVRAPSNAPLFFLALHSSSSPNPIPPTSLALYSIRAHQASNLAYFRPSHRLPCLWRGAMSAPSESPVRLLVTTDCATRTPLSCHCPIPVLLPPALSTCDSALLPWRLGWRDNDQWCWF